MKRKEWLEDKWQGSRGNERKNREEEKEEEKKRKSDGEATNGISPSVKLGVVELKCTKNLFGQCGHVMSGCLYSFFLNKDICIYIYTM